MSVSMRTVATERMATRDSNDLGEKTAMFQAMCATRFSIGEMRIALTVLRLASFSVR